MAKKWGIKISIPGVNVEKLADDSLDLILNTNFSTLKVNQSGSSGNSITYQHSLGYVPPFLVYVFNNLTSELRMSTPTDGVTTTVNATSSSLSISGGIFDSFGYYVFYNE